MHSFEVNIRCAEELHFLNYCSHKMIKFLIQNISPVKYTQEIMLVYFSLRPQPFVLFYDSYSVYDCCPKVSKDSLWE